MSKPLTCPNGHPIDPTWDVCPHCRAAAQERVGVPGDLFRGGDSPVKTLGGLPKPKFPPTPAFARPDQDPSRRLAGWLVCTNGPKTGLDYRLYDGGNTIGRHSECDVVVEHGLDSERAAMIEVRPDLGSYALGVVDKAIEVSVNSIVVTDLFRLNDDDLIRIGDAAFLFKRAPAQRD